jgi:hypothetical protein
MSIFQKAWDFIVAIAKNIQLTEESKVTMTPLQLITQQNTPVGPLPVTGGQCFKNTAAQNMQIAGLVMQSPSGVNPSLLLAWMFNESRLSVMALNPNHQLDVQGASVSEDFLHWDIGIAQFDGATLTGSFPAIKLPATLEAMAYDPAWAIPYMAAVVASNIAWAKSWDSIYKAANPTKTPLYGPNYLILAFEAYNSGRTGATDRAVNATVGNFNYGNGIYSRWVQFAALLGEPTQNA